MTKQMKKQGPIGHKHTKVEHLDDTDSGSESDVSQSATIITKIMATYPPNIKY
ncbi:hypothetical protein CROQUDRAFT_475565 [Cronartium quercuum f. sp. fusiforme G11]|uniref:Uncharacterized protein n=1 Tax=Cronartium quercuum f. sp. fusiforme G11 TaxID=708437 RepID=A0A9P6TCF4_9BASI|nr:hypothetical protein CROQUDRAFT_475565 [Cronartium quercuum f. sp. fusiforme G11]